MAMQLASVARGHYIEVTATILIRKAVMLQITKVPDQLIYDNSGR